MRRSPSRIADRTPRRGRCRPRRPRRRPDRAARRTPGCPRVSAARRYPGRRGGSVDAADEVDPDAAAVQPVPRVVGVDIEIWLGIGQQGAHGAISARTLAESARTTLCHRMDGDIAMAKRRAVALPAFVEDVLDGASTRRCGCSGPSSPPTSTGSGCGTATPAGEMIRLLERRYLTAVTAIGAASGGAAASSRGRNRSVAGLGGVGDLGVHRGDRPVRAGYGRGARTAHRGRLRAPESRAGHPARRHRRRGR